MTFYNFFFCLFQFVILALALFAVAQAAVLPILSTYTAAIPAEDTGKWDGCHWDGRAFDCARLGERFAPKIGAPLTIAAPLTIPAAYPSVYTVDALGRRTLDGLYYL